MWWDIWIMEKVRSRPDGSRYQKGRIHIRNHQYEQTENKPNQPIPKTACDLKHDSISFNIYFLFSEFFLNFFDFTTFLVFFHFTPFYNTRGVANAYKPTHFAPSCVMACTVQQERTLFSVFHTWDYIWLVLTTILVWPWTDGACWFNPNSF